MFKYTLYDYFLLTDAGSTVNNLGITHDRDLTFYDHIKKCCCKALKTLSKHFIKRVCVKFNLVLPLKTLYRTFVRSILEYTVVIWDPATASSKNQIEKIQHDFLSFLARPNHMIIIRYFRS